MIFLIAGGRLCQIGEDRATVLIKLFRGSAWQVSSSIPQPAAALPAPSTREYFLLPYAPVLVVFGTVSPRDSEKYVVVDPLHQGTNTIASKEVCTGIGDVTIRTYTTDFIYLVY